MPGSYGRCRLCPTLCRDENSLVFITLLWTAGPLRQIGNLRPIVNRPAAALASAQAGRLPIGRRFPICLTSSAEFLDIRRSEIGEHERHFDEQHEKRNYSSGERASAFGKMNPRITGHTREESTSESFTLSKRI